MLVLLYKYFVFNLTKMTWSKLILFGCLLLGFILCTPFSLAKGKRAPFLKLTPTLWQMPQDVKTIHEQNLVSASSLGVIF